ncbi:patatin-like phospholipase family protein [Aequorivita sp. 609]|uniref:patatin-like phospholipase family protein n=1 Tax=Aequorivita TaxID=153265 RepID=UPI00112421CB|nr:MULTISPECIES: patatin-like phospholipase family protein [Aequorivita]MBB6681274.1 patatin-like phospholipase family protein [Aequorivita sp. 609]
MRRQLLFFTAFLLFVQFIAHSQDSTNFKKKSFQGKKPKVALVLSGGGAKGIAHVPTLQVLDSLGIVPDLIIGNSMGSIVGALYAMGYSGDSITNILKKTEWDNLIGGGVALKDVSVEEKAEFGRYAIEMDWMDGSLKLGNFLVNDQGLRELITLLTFPVYDVTNFDDLAIPYRAIATDIVNGKELVLSKGSLALAMRASMSIPGVFQAVDYKETLLIDGGLLNNFPVDVAKRMGADIIIGSDVGDVPFTKEKLQSLPALMSQTTMLNSNKKRPQNRELCDVLIDHSGKLSYSSADFDKANILYENGKQAVLEKMDTLRALAKMLKNYEQIKVNPPKPRDKFSFDTITYNGVSDANLALVKAHLNLETDTPYNVNEVIEGVNRAMGTTIFTQIAYDIDINSDAVELNFNAVERSPHQLKGGLHYDGYNGIGVVLNYTGRNLLGDASRTVITADIAEQPKLRLQYQKNFSKNRNWWWRAELYGEQKKQKVYLQGDYVENVRNRYHSFNNQVNWNISPMRSYVGLGVRYHNTNIKPTINPNLNENIFKFSMYDNYDVELYAHYKSNSMNKVFFATEGSEFKGWVGRSLLGNLKVNFTDKTIPDYNGDTNGFTRLGVDYEKRFPVSNIVTAIIGAAGHFTIDDAESTEEKLYSGLTLNSKYSLGGNLRSARSDFYIFPGLQDKELVMSQFIKLNLATQINVMHKVYITPHFNVASVGFGDFKDYIGDAFSNKGKWSDLDQPSILMSTGATFSYNSILGPVNFDMSYVNNINKLRFFIGIGFHLDSSD